MRHARCTSPFGRLGMGRVDVSNLALLLLSTEGFFEKVQYISMNFHTR